MKSDFLIKCAVTQTTATENIVYGINLRDEFQVFFWNLPNEIEAFSVRKKKFCFAYVGE